VTPWLKRFGLHLAAAVGATGVFVAAAAVGASQVRQQVEAPPVATRIPRPARGLDRPTLVPAAPTPAPQPAGQQPAEQPAGQPAGVPRSATSGTRPNAVATPRVVPERSLAGTIRQVLPDGLDVVGVGGREWLVQPAPGALIRLNGKSARLDQLQPGDGLVILGQAQPGAGLHFLAHAITAKSK